MYSGIAHVWRPRLRGSLAFACTARFSTATALRKNSSASSVAGPASWRCAPRQRASQLRLQREQELSKTMRRCCLQLLQCSWIGNVGACDSITRIQDLCRNSCRSNSLKTEPLGSRACDTGCVKQIITHRRPTACPTDGLQQFRYITDTTI